jgi:hypothetical protein
MESKKIKVIGEIMEAPCLNMSGKGVSACIAHGDFEEELGFSLISIQATYEIMITNKELMKYCKDNEKSLCIGDVIEVQTTEYRDSKDGMYYLKLNEKEGIKIIKSLN